MALEITVTKKSVTQVMLGAFNVTLNLTCTESGAEVINQDFTVLYKSGTPVQRVIDAMKLKMQEAINAWKAADVINDSTALANALTTIKNGLAG